MHGTAPNTLLRHGSTAQQSQQQSSTVGTTQDDPILGLGRREDPISLAVSLGFTSWDTNLGYHHHVAHSQPKNSIHGIQLRSLGTNNKSTTRRTKQQGTLSPTTPHSTQECQPAIITNPHPSANRGPSLGVDAHYHPARPRRKKLNGS